MSRARRSFFVAVVLMQTPVLSAAQAEVVEIRPASVVKDGVVGVEYRSGDQLVGTSIEASPAGVELLLPGGKPEPVRFRTKTEREGVLELGPEKIGALSLRWRIARKTPSLVERTLEVTAERAQQFAVTFALDLALDGQCTTFSGPEKSRTLCDTVRGSAKTETFPVAMLRTSGSAFGIVADSPGLWENRCQVLLDPASRRLAVLTGDGRAAYPLVVKPPEDARDTYQYPMDGWQSLAAGQTRRFTTWVFASPARNHYDAQVAAHLAVANAKGWNSSVVEAILRNTSLYLLRRNLARDANNQPRDGRYIFISGPGYGWKQWVSDGFYTALGLDDPEKTIESNRAVFWTRMDYEDNSHYYLIWAVLMKRAGGTVNEALVRKAYEFIRGHEIDGYYIPPSLPGSPNPKGWKTYHDVLLYDDGDCPTSNQGFHCGALLAAQELGLGATEQDLQRAIAAYRSLFNAQRGFMPTSRKQRDTLGQDTLYGATLTYAVFGKKVLSDEQVLTHYRTSEKVKTPFGLRVISQADGSLLPGHSGVYCYGGSWFLNDAANYLLAGVHGLPAAEVDALLVERIAREIALVPAFNESISTVTGQPHGHILYSWNSGFWWLRKEIRRRLGQTGPDPVGAAIDARLNVVRERDVLRLEIDRAAKSADGLTPLVACKAEPFALEDVRLLEGPLRHAMQLDRKYLLSLDPDRLLHVFRLHAGLPSTAKPYGGWMAPEHNSRGEFVGHYLSACSLMYASTGDAEIKARVDRVVAGWAECQQKLGHGFLHAHPDRFTSRCEAPLPFWYQMHKILAGLLDAHRYCGNQQALDVARKLGDWACAGAARFSDAQIQAMLNTEHGGINEALANLAARTGDPKYLKLSLRFDHRAVIGPAIERVDALDGLHANTQIPKFIGAARQYELTGTESLKTAARFFWETVVRERSYAIGGHSDGEAFTPKATLSKALGPSTCETCNTYNMLKLTRHLFCWEPKAEYADYYERALYNHILASQNPETGMMCYYVPLKTGCAKGRLNPTGFSTPEDSFWCCVGTGIENHAKHGDSIYFRGGNDTLYVNLFVASELNWRERGVTLRQETDYPQNASTRLAFRCQQPVELAVLVRHPCWATSGIRITINGKAEASSSAPGSYACLKRTWQTGDTVQVDLPMGLHTEAFRDNPQRLALLYGPLVLCTTTGAGAREAAIVAQAGHVLDTVKPAAGTGLTFTGSASVFRTGFDREDGDVTFIPFYREYKNPYVVYWDLLSPAQWKAKQAEHEAELARQKVLAARTVDVIRFEPDSEQAHKLTGEKSATGPHEDIHWRHAVDGGWFSFEMAVKPDKPLELWCTYWGGDVGREFDILVDGVRIATQTLQNNCPGRLFEQKYAIPETLTKGKAKVRVKFQAHPGSTAGGVFGCRLMVR